MAEEKKISRRDLLKSMSIATGGFIAGSALSSCSAGSSPPTAATPADASSSAGGEAEEVPAETQQEEEQPAAAPVAQSGEAIRVVGIFPLSGFIAADGEEMRNGLVMAVDEINEMGGLLGRQLEYIEIDDVSSQTDEITTAFNRAVDVEDADVIISGYHLATGPEFDIVANGGKLYYNVNTQKAWTDRYQSDPEKYWGIFQCDPNDEWYGGGFALWLQSIIDAGIFTPPNGNTTAILAGDDPYDSFIAQVYEDTMTELGWEITGKESFTAGNMADWGPLLSGVHDNPPSVLFTTDYNPADNAAMAKQLAADPLPSLVYQQYGPSVPEYLELAGEAANGIIWATVLGLLPDEIGNDFRARYEQKFGQPPGWANAGGVYDTTWVWAKAVALAGDPKDYQKIASITERSIHRGVTGSISFVNHAGRQYPSQTNDASLGQPHIIVQIQDGEHKVISPAPYTSGEFQLPPWMA
jgi:branched-chain amino acid transport system substrate-binding protein